MIEMVYRGTSKDGKGTDRPAEKYPADRRCRIR